MHNVYIIIYVYQIPFYIIDHNKTRYTEKKVSLSLLCGVQHSVIMAVFIMPETQQPIIVIFLIIYFPYLLKDLVEL